MANEVGFIELDALVEPRLVRLQAALSHHLCSKQNGEEFRSVWISPVVCWRPAIG